MWFIQLCIFNNKLSDVREAANTGLQTINSDLSSKYTELRNIIQWVYKRLESIHFAVYIYVLETMNIYRSSGADM